MGRSKRCLVLVFALLVLLLPVRSGALEPGQIMAGAAEVEITPQVLKWEDANGNGRFDMGDPTKPFALGEKVLSFREGPNFVGNGNGTAQYVHGPIFASALVLEDPETKTRVAYVSTDLYLLLQHDVDAIRGLVGVTAAIDYIVIAPTHTHMGPDTLGLASLSGLSAGDVLRIVYTPKEFKGGVNRVWFEAMMRKTALAIEQAAFTMAPATIRVAKTKFSFGMTDEREPLILDDDLMILAVDSADGDPIATVIQGNCHPESVLLYGHPLHSMVDRKSLPENVQKAWGRVFSPGFPGQLRRTVREKRGGVPLYFNGALGGMITNIFSKIWDPEKHPEYPIDADPAPVPEDIKIPPDFRFMAVQGREMAKAALTALKEKGEDVKNPDVSFAKKDILMPLQNPIFRLASALGIMGYAPGMLYHDDGRPDADVGRCVSGLCVTGLWIPKGRNLKTEVGVVNVGPAQFINVPSELLGELSVGIPDDFATNEKKYFPKNAKSHPTGEDFVLLYPPLKKQATRSYPFIIGLANNNMGYVIPECDFKPPHDLWYLPPLSWWWICFDSSVHPHYEESNTASRKMEERIMGGLTDILKRQK